MKDLAALYGELFDLFKNSKWAKDDLAAFKVQVGDNYCKGPLFIGRATNGWTSFCPVQSNRDDFMQNNSLSYKNKDFSNWVSNNGNDHYKISRSQFWQDAKKIFERVCDGNFANEIAYSNLYKIARQGANPTTKQCALQLNVCREILLAEITALKPKCIIFIAGYGWAKCFLQELHDVKIDTVFDDKIECSGSIAGYPFVVIHHPQGKTTLAREQAVRQTIEYLKR